MIKRFLKKTYEKIIGISREIYYNRLRKKLKITRPTIIASDCFGTFVYHNLGLKFQSPTINLFFSKNDFILFVQHLKSFLNAELIQVIDPSKSYPIGKLEYNGINVQIDFMHYKTFDEAKNKWDERKKRVDYSKIYVIQLIAAGVTEDDIDSFDNLPYENKMLIANKNLTNSKNVVTHTVFSQESYYPGKILNFKSRFSIRRYMDEIDYVGFLNTGKIE